MLRKSCLFLFFNNLLCSVGQTEDQITVNQSQMFYSYMTCFYTSFAFMIIFMLIGCSRFVNVHLCICPFSSSASANRSPQTASQAYYRIMSPTINYLLTIHLRSSIYGNTGRPPSLQLRHR